MKIILAGPPRSGKSCLRHALPKAVARVSQDRHYLYVIKGAPDGEGAWFHETCERDDSEAFTLRNEYKYPITEEFTARLEREVACCDAPLTAIDIGGRVSDENRRICRAASHAVLLAGNHPERGTWQERLIEWHRFCGELGIEVIAELQSDYDASQDEITGLGPDGIFRASIHHLERGEPISDRPAILELAKHIVGLVQELNSTKGEPLHG
jgi:CRISPR-associated protein Csx3